MKNKYLFIFWLCFYLAIFAVLLNNSFSALDNDFGWHLKVGEQIVKEKSVPNFDYYNYTLEGKTWVDHEWLSNAAMYLIYNKFGHIALNVFFALIVIAILVILNIFSQKLLCSNKKTGLLALLQILGVFASLPHLGLRVQELSILGLLLLLIIIARYNKKQNYQTLIFIPILFYFWASFHGGFLIGLAVMFLWLLIKISELILEKIKFFSFIDFGNRLSPNKLKTFFWFFLAGLGATLLTPYGLKLYGFLGYYKNSFYLKYIIEWLPFYFPPLNYWQLIFEGILMAVVLLAIYEAIKKKSYKIPLWEVLISIFFLGLALKSKRHFPLLFIASFPFLIKYFCHSLAPSSLDPSKSGKKSLAIIKIYVLAGLLSVAALKLIETQFTNDPFTLFKNTYPYGAVNFLKEHQKYDNLKIFNNYDWGGYLIWTMPEKKLFIDGRLPMLPFAGHTFLEEYYEFFDKNKVGKKISQYDIGLILINNKERYIRLDWFEKFFLMIKEEDLNNKKNYLKDYLNASPDWRLAYKDEISNIYVKK